MIPDMLSDNFKRSEFACNGLNCCNHSAPVMPDLIKVLQAIRDEFCLAIYINRGYSCKTYNATLSKNPYSWHTVGGAADCSYFRDIATEKIFLFAKDIPELGAFGFYDGHFHVDVRPRAAGRITVWDKRR